MFLQVLGIQFRSSCLFNKCTFSSSQPLEGLSTSTNDRAQALRPMYFHFVCMCVRTRIRVHALHEVCGSIFLHCSPPYFFRQGLSLNMGAQQNVLDGDLKDLSSVTISHTGIMGVYGARLVIHTCQSSNPGPHACLENTLPTEQSPQPPDSHSSRSLEPSLYQ